MKTIFKSACLKKTIILWVLAMAAIWPVKSQDTLHMRNMRLMENYFVDKWPDWFELDSVNKCYRGSLSISGEWARDQAKEYAERMYTEDTLQVYGIAASVTTTLLFYPDMMEDALSHGWDTSHANTYDYWRLYEADADSLRHVGGEELWINPSWTPVSYYLDLDMYRGTSQFLIPILPMYERYFSSPIEVTDSFYVGRRFGPGMDVLVLGVCPIRLSPNDPDPPFPGQYGAAHFDWATVVGGDSVVIKKWRYIQKPLWPNYRLVFPILAPPDTTSSSGTDTTGVGVNTVLYRYTTVSPNPATGRVKVLSSFGLQHIEAYDAAGVRVYEGKAEGLSATLDVSSWPKGIYVLRITTGSGPTTKKLLVQ